MRVLLLILGLAVAASPVMGAEVTAVRDGDRIFAALPAPGSEVGLFLEGLRGTKITVKVKARTPALEPEILMIDPDGREMRLDLRYRHSPGSPKARIKRLVLPETGVYWIVGRSVSSSGGVGGEVKIKVRVEHPRKFKAEGAVSTAVAESLFAFPAFAGSTVKYKVKGRDGFRPRAERMLLPGVEEAALSTASATGGVLQGERFSCPTLGDYRLVVTGEDGAVGAWRSKVKLRHPEHGNIPYLDQRTILK